MREETITKLGLGTIRIIGDPENDFTIADIAFGEYVDPAGVIYALTRQQVIDIVTTALGHVDATRIACMSVSEAAAD